MKTPDEIKKEWADDALCQIQFFMGQRAGRELWVEKPHDIQEKDLDCFNRNVETVRAYIQQLERERDALLDALKKADVYGECENCKHRDSAPSDCDCECESCQRNCRCWECRDGDKSEWVGVKEEEKE